MAGRWSVARLWCVHPPPTPSARKGGVPLRPASRDARQMAFRMPDRCLGLRRMDWRWSEGTRERGIVCWALRGVVRRAFLMPFAISGLLSIGFGCHVRRRRRHRGPLCWIGLRFETSWSITCCSASFLCLSLAQGIGCLRGGEARRTRRSSGVVRPGRAVARVGVGPVG